MTTLRQINLIEEPLSEEIIQQELEEVLGGWNCGTYSDGWFRDKCKEWNSGNCTEETAKSANYCIVFDKHI